MKLCPACDRHLFGAEPICPFCGATQATVAARPEGGAFASIALVLTLGTAACGPQVLVPVDESTSAESTGPVATATTTLATTSNPTTSVTTIEPTTDDGPAMTTIEPSSSSSNGDDDPCAFYAGCPPDVSTRPRECDVFQQDCPLGEKCVPWAEDGGSSWTAVHCAPVAPDPATVGEPCTVEGYPTSGIDDCDLGSLCFGVDALTLQGTCVAQCEGTPMAAVCPDPEQVCWISDNETLNVCLQACHPLMSDCPEGTGCLSDGDPFACFPTAGDGVFNDNCAFLNDCSAGYVCEGALPFCAGSCCTQFCDLTMPDCPNGLQGVECEAWFPEGRAPPGFENVGFCDW